jgi:NADH:ubiquinone oxidoreductase subunit 6 (subunit J)
MISSGDLLLPVLAAADGGLNWHGFFFLLFAVLACSLAVAVVLADNVVRMAFYLVLSLGATAGLFFLAGAEFVGAMQLMIYVGGTLVLLIFGVMLTAQEPFVSIKTPTRDKVLAGVVGGALLAVLLQAAVSGPAWSAVKAMPPGSEVALQPSATPLGMALVGVRVDGDVASGERSPADGQVRSGYLLPFEIVSVHLLVVLVGAAYLARTKRRKASSAPRADMSMGVMR